MPPRFSHPPLGLSSCFFLSAGGFFGISIFRTALRPMTSDVCHPSSHTARYNLSQSTRAQQQRCPSKPLLEPSFLFQPRRFFLKDFVPQSGEYVRQSGSV